jgi:hypothetical protein
MRVLVACEFSGVVREAFNAYSGVYAISCDLLPPEDGRTDYHYQGDVRDIIHEGWDLMIAHPPCTFLCTSGLHWNKRIPGRQELTDESLEFVKLLLDAPIPRIALENPIGCISTQIRKPDQIIQPYQFGEDASKATCLWLKGLPLLETLPKEEWYPPRIVDGKKRWGNQTDSGQNKLTPSDTRWMERSRTYSCIAQAMAEQWIKCFSRFSKN